MSQPQPKITFDWTWSDARRYEREQRLKRRAATILFIAAGLAVLLVLAAWG